MVRVGFHDADGQGLSGCTKRNHRNSQVRRVIQKYCFCFVVHVNVVRGCEVRV